MTNPFKPAEKTQAKLRLALIGPAGSGKTYTALSIAGGLGDKVALIDTERGSASKYADLFGFDVLELTSYAPERYIDAIDAAVKAGYDVLVIDSLSHAWAGKDGILELVDHEKARAQNKWTGPWGKATPLHNRLVDAMLAAPVHLIATMRSKMAYVQALNDKGQQEVRKVGMQPVQRDGLEYEFDVVGDLDDRNTLVISKSRCIELAGQVIDKPGADLAATLAAWLGSGKAGPERGGGLKLPAWYEPLKAALESEKLQPADVAIVTGEATHNRIGEWLFPNEAAAYDTTERIKALVSATKEAMRAKAGEAPRQPALTS